MLKYRVLFLSAILLPLPAVQHQLSDQERKIINKLAKDTLVLYALKNGISPKDHLKTITGMVFGNSNVALIILTKKIMRHVCKQTYVHGLPKLALYAVALQKFDRYQQPTKTKDSIKKTVKEKIKALSPALSFLGKTAAVILVLIIILIISAEFLEKTNELKTQFDKLSEEYNEFKTKVESLKKTMVEILKALEKK